MKDDRLLKALSYILVAALAVMLTLAVVQGTAEPESKLEELENLIEEKFIGEADPAELENAAAEAMVTATGDRWSYYIPADEYADYLDRMANAYVGVGITIQWDESGEGYLILSVAPGSPAEEAGMQSGDLLIEAAGQSLRDLDINAVGALVSGEEGTSVTLLVLRRGDPVSFNVERRRLEKQVADFEMLPDNIGLVTIYNFDSRCAEETIAAIETLRTNGAEKLIFDVRYNPGGYAHELVKVLDYLLPEGDLFRTMTYDGKEDVDRSDADYLDMPMAVLVNQHSYSAAEFFAAALQEYEAAVVVGQHTTGKGYFQTTYQLSDGSAVSLSIGKYFTPKGVSLADVGVTPDVELELEEEADTKLYSGILPPAEDPQIQAAVEALSDQ